MCDIRAKVLANDNVPGGPVPFVKLLLDLCGDVLLDVVLLEGSRGHIDGLLLQLLAHVNVLDDSLGPCAVVFGEGARVRAGWRVDFVCHGVG